MGKNLRLRFADPDTNSYKIKVVGVGGAGGNIVNTMIKKGLNGIDFIAINTDRQALTISQAHTKIQIGVKLTKGLGSGGKPYIGTKAIEENYEDVKEALKNTDVIFITCGMGGGTGTGASPVTAKIAKELGSFAVGVVTFPFNFEGSVRANQAKEGMQRLKKYTDTVLTVSNQKLFSLVDEKISFATAFEMANQVLFQIVRGIVEIINSPGLVNVDFADVCAVISEPGETFIGIGTAKGEGRATRAARQAIDSALLGEKTIRYATGALVNIRGDSSFTLYEAEEVMKVIRETIPVNANIIFGAYIDENMKDEIRITLIGTGIKHEKWGTIPDIIGKGENLKIPTFKRRTQPYTEDMNIGENENLDIPTFIRRQNELNS